MNGETIALVVAAVIGSTGVAAAIGSFTQLSLRNRLQTNIRKNIDLLNSLPASAKSRKALEASIEHDTVMLSVLSLRRADPGGNFIRMVGGLVFPIAMILIGVLAAVWILDSTQTVPSPAATSRKQWGFTLSLAGLALGYIPAVVFLWSSLQRSRRVAAVDEILHREGITVSDLGLIEERTFWGNPKN